MLKRIFKNTFNLPFLLQRHFSKTDLASIETAIARSESMHQGEVRVAIESSFSFLEILNGKTPRDRALEIFSQYRVWDTQHNTGILIYILLSEHDIEIIADRGIHDQEDSATWEKICQSLQHRFQKGEYLEGLLEAIGQSSKVLQQHVPAKTQNINELPNKPIVIS